MPRRPVRPRIARRLRERAYTALAHDLDELWRLAPGGAPERPLPIESPAQVEPIADAARCPLCEAPMTREAHEVVEHDGVRLRVARLRCNGCGGERALYFRLPAPLQ